MTARIAPPCASLRYDRGPRQSPARNAIAASNTHPVPTIHRGNRGVLFALRSPLAAFYFQVISTESLIVAGVEAAVAAYPAAGTGRP